MAVCAICGEKLGLKKVMIKGRNYICYNCVKEAGFHPLTWTGNLKTSLEELEARIAGTDNFSEAPEFTPTRTVGLLEIDEDKKLWRIIGGQERIHSYEDVLDCQLMEDASYVTTGGLGSAVAGGVAFGIAGAAVGAAVGKKKTKPYCSSMSVQVTLKDMKHPMETVPLLQRKVAKDSSVYQRAYAQGQEICAILKVMPECAGARESERAPGGGVADEILKFKQLLDAGAITQEEFDRKKKELLK